MSGSLDDPWARQKRAIAHMGVLETEHGFGSDLKSHPVRIEKHHDGLEYRLYLLETEPPLHPDIPFIISECLFNLRAALDQMIYQLHVRHYRGKVPADAEKDSAFPILDSLQGRSEDTRKWREIRRLSARQRATIRNLQPYIKRNDRWCHTRERLSALSMLNKVDKHRRLHVVRGINAPVDQGSLFPPETGFRQRIYHRPLAAGEYVERWMFTDPPEKMGENHRVWSQVVVEEPTMKTRFYIYDFLWFVIADVETILLHFSDYFPNDRPSWQRL